jgi:hypothetical protein
MAVEAGGKLEELHHGWSDNPSQQRAPKDADSVRRDPLGAKPFGSRGSTKRRRVSRGGQVVDEPSPNAETFATSCAFVNPIPRDVPRIVMRRTELAETRALRCSGSQLDSSARPGGEEDGGTHGARPMSPLISVPRRSPHRHRGLLASLVCGVRTDHLADGPSPDAASFKKRPSHRARICGDRAHARISTVLSPTRIEGSARRSCSRRHEGDASHAA